MKGLSRTRARLLGAAGAGFPLGAAGAAFPLGAAGAAFLLGGAGAAFLLGGAGVSPAFGQVVGTGTWLWDVTSQDGDNIVHPGETATITLSLDLSPSVGEKGQSGGSVKAFGGAIFDTIGGVNANRGTIVGWKVNPSLTFIVGDVTTTDGVSLFGTSLLQVCGEVCDPNDPIHVLALEWQPSMSGTFEVHYATATDSRLIAVWEGIQLELWTTVIEASVSFHVVPVPGALALLLPAFLMGIRRGTR
jgi:hypothetical protein